jgi:hypothetical protein
MLRETVDSFEINTIAFHLRFNPNILSPESIGFENSCLDSIVQWKFIPEEDGASVRITLGKPLTNFTLRHSPVVTLKAKVYLNPSIQTDVTIDSFATDREPAMQFCDLPTQSFQTILECGSPALRQLMTNGRIFLTIDGISPNPVRSKSDWTLQYHTAWPEEMQFDLYNASGTLVYRRTGQAQDVSTPQSVHATAGARTIEEGRGHTEVLPVPEADGDYFLVIRSQSGSAVRKLSVQR